MSQSGMLVTMRIPVERGRFFYIQFDPSQPVDFAPLLKMEWRTSGAEGAPLHSKPTKESGASAPLLHLAPLPSQKRRSTSPPGGFHGELEQARTALADRSSELARLDEILAPVWADEREVRDDLMATYSQHGNIVVLNLGRATDRKPLFRRLSKIAERWGKTKEERRQVYSHVRSLEREITKLEKLIEAEKRKGASNGKRASA